MGFSERLCGLMNKRCETCYRLAKELGCSQSTVRNWLFGVTKPTRVMLNALSAHYGCTVDELLEKE